MSYNNSSHYPNSGYQSVYPQYPQSYGGSYNYQGYGQYANQPSQQSTEGFSAPTNWNSSGYGSSQKDAVAQEMQQQKAQLTKQREDYVKKGLVLRHELEQLRVQKNDLAGDGRGDDHELANILRQNDKLQDEIQGKMKAIHNVIEMLSSIIKDNRSIGDLEASLREPQSPKKSPKEAARAVTKSKTPEPGGSEIENYCYVHYDTGLHWCRLCDEFPETAKDFLLHLQDKKHREMAKENDVDNTPWHKLPAEPVLPSNENAPKKRIPIKGLQFFISAPSWYCKLCDVWIGDLHCASHHLKSRSHFQNYENFVSQNPQWEVDWIKDREKTMARKVQQDSSDSDSSKRRKKRKDKRHSMELFAKDKKKKRKSKKKRKQSSDSSSSSSSDSSSDDDNDDKSRSIRVAMRNMKQVQSIMDEDLSAKWNVLEKLVEEHKKKELRDKEEQDKKEAPEDPLINQWMTVSQPPPKDKQMLENLKDRMRLKQEQERAKLAEMEQRRREKEREELERLEKRKMEERLAAEEAEKDRKRRDQMEMDRIRDKERNQVKFKTNYRRRRSRSRSAEEENHQERHYRHESSSSSRHRKDSESRSYKERESRSRSRSPARKSDDSASKKKPPGPPSYKKLPFIGRMPLFKNKNKAPEEKEDVKEIKKQAYELPRRTRFEPGNLPRAFIPRPDVVCFPKLSSIPPLNLPPPPPTVAPAVVVPQPPKISVEKKVEESDEAPTAPPPPKLDESTEKPMNLSDDEALYGPGGIDPSIYYQDYQNSMYPQNDVYSYESTDEPIPPPPPPHPHGLPLEPPPLPPDDDLAMLGICADDMAAQSF